VADSKHVPSTPRRGRTGRGDGSRAARTRAALLAAAETCLRELGFTNLSTRRIADEAGVPLSQIHYHFGSMESLMLALLAQQNRRLLDRQQRMFAADVPLWRRWRTACDFLDEDLASGYVRVLQEMTAAGWSSPEIAAAVRDCLRGWFVLLTSLAGEAAERFGGLAGLEPDDLACLIGNAFLGAEAMLLLGFEDEGMPVRRALHRVGEAIRRLEEPGAPAEAP
jgi:AcrR family transcriptional regulator